MTRAFVKITPRHISDIHVALDLWQRAEALPRTTDHPTKLLKPLEQNPQLFLLARDATSSLGSSRPVGTGGGASCTVWPSIRIARAWVLLKGYLKPRKTVGYNPDTATERYAKDLEQSN